MIYLVQESKISYKRKRNTQPIVRATSVAVDIFRSIEGIDEIIDYKEVLYALYLNHANECVAIMKISEGGITSSPYDVRTIMQGALLNNATSFIILHNHPSGSLKQSTHDKNMFLRLQQAGLLMDIVCLDSIVVTKEGYKSAL